MISILIFYKKLNGRIENPLKKEIVNYGKGISIRNQW